MWVSKIYCLAFTRHLFLRAQSLHGEAGSINSIAVAKDILQLHVNLSEYSVDHTYNIDETGLSHKLINHCTYVLESEGRHTVRVVKVMKEKDRIMVFLCMSADGSHKVPMSIMGKALNSCFFRMGKQRRVLHPKERVG